MRIRGDIINIMESVTRFLSDIHHKKRKLPEHAAKQAKDEMAKYHAASDALSLVEFEVVSVSLDTRYNSSSAFVVPSPPTPSLEWKLAIRYVKPVMKLKEAIIEKVTVAAFLLEVLY